MTYRSHGIRILKLYRSVLAAAAAAAVVTGSSSCAVFADAAVITGRGSVIRKAATFQSSREDSQIAVSPAAVLPSEYSILGEGAPPMLDVIDIEPRETTVDPRTLDPNYKPPYDFSAPVPELAEPVGDDYFDDALFIGDSRTEGMRIYGKKKGYYYSQVAFTVGQVLTKKIIYDPEDDEKKTVIDYVEKYKDVYKKVYMQFGLNECGGSVQWLRTVYEHVLETLRGVLPEGTPIYVQAVLPVTHEAELKSPYGITNEKIDNVNRMLAEMCESGGYYYLAINEPFMDEETGELNAEESNDGIHMGGPGVARQFDYIKSHVVIRDMWDWGDGEAETEPALPSEEIGEGS